LAAAISCIVVALAPGRLYLTEWRTAKRGAHDILNAPFRNFAADLKNSAQNCDYILTSTYWLGGNLHLWFPDKHIFSPDVAPPTLAYPGQKCLMVWNAERRSEPPAELKEFAHSFAGNDADFNPTFIEEKWKYHHTKMMRLGFALLERKVPAQPDPASH